MTKCHVQVQSLVACKFVFMLVKHEKCQRKTWNYGRRVADLKGTCKFQRTFSAKHKLNLKSSTSGFANTCITSGYHSLIKNTMIIFEK